MGWERTTLIAGNGRHRSLSDLALRDEAKEVRPDARPQARKNRRRIRWNTLRIFWAENRANVCGSFAAVERLISDRLLGKEISRVSPNGFVKVERTAAMLFRSIHGR